MRLPLASNVVDDPSYHVGRGGEGDPGIGPGLVGNGRVNANQATQFVKEGATRIALVHRRVVLQVIDGIDVAVEIIRKLNQLRHTLLIDCRIHARFEVNNHDTVPILSEMLEQKQVEARRALMGEA